MTIYFNFPSSGKQIMFCFKCFYYQKKTLFRNCFHGKSLCCIQDMVKNASRIGGML